VPDQTDSEEFYRHLDRAATIRLIGTFGNLISATTVERFRDAVERAHAQPVPTAACRSLLIRSTTEPSL
jgi:hypothetical protein